MRTSPHTIVRLLTTLAIPVLLLCATSRLSAQRWQYDYGSANSLEIGMRGVQPVSTGGYIAAGSSHGSSGIMDTYVVKTNDDGSLAWSYTYNLENGGSGANCIRECRNGDFIVLSTTQAQSSCCCNPNNVVLMRLKSDGSVIWVKSYGSTRVETGSSVIELSSGDGEQTSAGDFAVCGSATASDGTVRGYIFRTTAGGKLIWDNTIALKRTGGLNLYCVSNQFSDLDESSDGTILTVGTVQDASGSATRGVVFRIDGSTGSPTGNQRWWQIDGLSTSGASIKELSGIARGTNAGDIVVTGTIDRGSGTTTAYIGRWAATSCNPAVTKYYLRGQTSVGLDIEERANGNLLMAGTGLLTGITASQALILEVEPATLTTTGTTALHAYGAGSGNQGASVAEVAGSGSRTAGFILAGTTNNADQLYLVKTDLSGDANCNWSAPDCDVNTPTSLSNCDQYNETRISQWCQPIWTADPRTWEHNICYVSMRTSGGAGSPAGEPAGVAASSQAAGTTVALSDDASLSGYPNPVRKGSIFNLQYALARAGRITVDVVDVTGKTVFTHSGDFPNGTSQIPVNTEGWPTGAYLIKLSAGGATASQQITVVDK